MSLATLQGALRQVCNRLPISTTAAPSHAAPCLQAPPRQLTSLLSLVFPTGSTRAGFATDATTVASDAEPPLHPSAAMHIRRAWEKPHNSDRNAYYRAEKKKLQIRANARARKKQQAAANVARDAARVAKWRTGAALWMSTQKGSEEDHQQG